MTYPLLDRLNLMALYACYLLEVDRRFEGAMELTFDLESILQ